MLSNDTMDLYRSTIMSWVEDPGVKEFRGLDLTKLDIDEAYVVLKSGLENVSLYTVSDTCYRGSSTVLKMLASCRAKLSTKADDIAYYKTCSYELAQMNGSAPLVVNTAYGVAWRLFQGATDKFLSTKNRSGLLCELRPELGEFGVYTLNVTSGGCALTTDKEPVNIYMPLAVAALVLGGAGALLAAACALLALARRKGKMRYGEAELAAPQRLRSVDTFRGLVIVMMIFVNSGGGRYRRWLEHAEWNGLQVADVVFPCFVWIMGACIPLSIKGVLARGVPRIKALLAIVRRSCILFLLGVSCNTVLGANFLSSIRVMNVLQRLGLSYLAVASCYLLTTRKYFTHPKGACGQALKDVWAAAGCWLLAAAALALHTAVTLRLHDPDCPPGYLGPGGRHDNFAVPSKCVGGAAGYLDRLVLGQNHIYSAYSIYDTVPFDHENILGTLTTIVHVVLGLQAGTTLLHYKSHKSRVARWLSWAVVLALIGAILAGFSKEKGIIPINKKLWSISFVLVLSALSCVLQSACYLLTDTWRLWSGAPFHAPGRNALFLYLAHSLCTYVFPFAWRVYGARTHAVFLIEHVWTTAMWVLVAHIMARKSIFVTI